MIITFDVLNTLQECARWVWLAGRAEDNLINGLTNTSNKAWPASKNWIYVCWQKLAICWSISTELNCCCGGGPGFQKSGQVYIWLDLQNSARTKEPVLMFFFLSFRNYLQRSQCKGKKNNAANGRKSAETRDFSELLRRTLRIWTRDLQIFSLTLSQLSYLGNWCWVFQRNEAKQRKWNEPLLTFKVSI